MKVKDRMGLADSPNDLIEGMSHFIQQVGVGSSYLDKEDPVVRAANKKKWLVILRGLLKPNSLEGIFFQNNLRDIRAEWEKKEKEAKSRALRKKFKFKAAMTRGFNSTDRSKANEMGGRDSQTVLDTSIVAGDVHNTRNLNMSYDGSQHRQTHPSVLTNRARESVGDRQQDQSATLRTPCRHSVQFTDEKKA